MKKVQVEYITDIMPCIIIGIMLPFYFIVRKITYYNKILHKNFTVSTNQTFQISAENIKTVETSHWRNMIYLIRRKNLKIDWVYYSILSIYISLNLRKERIAFSKSVVANETLLLFLILRTVDSSNQRKLFLSHKNKKKSYQRNLMTSLSNNLHIS